jgi:two-component system, chemotaxis family, CheB/CheR fusion protein
VDPAKPDGEPKEKVPVVERAAPEAPASPFLVVGVGASAGGLEAFSELLQHVPDEPNLAFLFVQHLQPHRPSLMKELLSRVTKLKVQEAGQGMRLEANNIYVIPPDSNMALTDGTLELSPREEKRGANMPADHLFRSLAEVQKNLAVGVLLSGGGTDGTLGFHAIKAEGGVTFAQDEKTAKYDSMPRSAILEGDVDYVLSPGEIARQLMRLAGHPYAAPAPPEPPPPAEETLDEIIKLLRSRTEVDFTQYKRSTIIRRIQRRMALRSLESFSDYLQFVQKEPAELQNLYQDFLIRVTRFFRDEEVFTALKEKVFPLLARDRSLATPLRVWVAGCSTGEEVYSLAIALLEFFGDAALSVPMKILATDVNESALDRARAGVYIDNIEMDITTERLRRFFAKQDGRYQISKAVRDLCVFSKHNLASDPPFSHLDLVSCRNVLIYMDARLQKRVLPMLHYALKPGGFLVLGSSETIGGFGELFDTVDPKHRIYSKNPVARANLMLDFGGGWITPFGSPRTATGQAGWTALDVQHEADRVILSRYAPVGVVVDENLTVLQFRGHTGAYLEPAPGLASLDFLKMLREGLLGPVRNTIERAKAENVTTRTERIPVKDQGEMRLVNVEVVPLKTPPSGGRLFMVLFQDVRPATPASEAPHGASAESVADAEPQVSQLQQELAATREYLQSVIEEYESACEELKSASEEILSSNEELQSTNEELQTAKEETQSANEELATVNEELHHRNAELTRSNNDLVNFLAAVSIPMIIVTRDMRIRRFTPMAEKLFNLIPTDAGRPITDIKPNVQIADLGQLLSQVVDSLVPYESVIQDPSGRWYAFRIRPYITQENKIEGASIALMDIDALKRELDSFKQAKS